MTEGGAENIFSEILDRTRTLDPVNTRKWFDNLHLVRFTGGLLEIGCPDEACAHFLQNKCKSSFTRAAQFVTGHLVTVQFSANGQAKQSFAGSTHKELLPLHPD